MLPPPPGPEEPGPFAFADPERVRRILEAGGWRAIEVEAYEDEIVDDLDRRVDFALRQGPAARALASPDEDVRAAAAVRVRDSLAPDAIDGVVRLRRAAWIVSARA